MKWVIQHIKQLVNTRTNSIVVRGAELSQLPIIDHAFLVIENGIIQAYGSMHELTKEHTSGAEWIDAAGASVLPCWCDSHTHLVFAASREEEFVHKINGLSYAEIAAKGGGILNSAQKIALASEDELYEQAMARLHHLMKLGTGAIEIKSGYGLNTANELKMLRVIKRIKETAPIPVKSSFLGAHTYPLDFKENHEGYIKQIIEEMLPVIAQENLADYIDVFCEDGFFSVTETKRICEAGIGYGLKPKIHANQLHASGGVELGVQIGAVSVDHLETMNDSAIQALSKSTTIGTMLPTAAFFLRMPYPPARELIQANAALAIASDYNPGSSPSGNMNFVVALSCIQMKMLPEEAINAATINGAFAMELDREVGSITVGKRANIIFTQPIPSLAYLPYSFGTNLIDKVMINGQFI
ncbi:imidazolonepropionase [Sediminibacterium sp.]|uniref:imidazolonepropionase n=1 Tax=Sediminibacterium sp. TaxID=1917865 RepID=UPI002715A48C|nr:imidazolonepropionase [Sediminibacterium sp.]MDO9156709.1 imidazolonepropionase [Sediminibacterium sp.]MDP2422197.1 imidazolonepropionase [Sediminibacterium sp.]